MPLATVTLESAWSPPVTISTDDLGTTVKAPGGEPGEAWQLVLPLAAVLVLGVVALAVYGASRLVRR